MSIQINFVNQDTPADKTEKTTAGIFRAVGGRTDNVQLSYAGIKKRQQNAKDVIRRHNGKEINVASYTDEYLKFRDYSA